MPRARHRAPPRRRLDGEALAAALFDLASRLSVPTALLVLSQGAIESAWAAAAVVNGLGVARGLWMGRIVERVLAREWARLIDAAGRHDVAYLRTRNHTMKPSVLVFAAHREALVTAVTLPRIAADAVGLAVTAAAVVWQLGAVWLGAGAGAALVVLPVVMLVSRQIGRREREGFDTTMALVERCELLVDGAIELRAHGVAARAEGAAMDQAAVTAARKRSVTAWRALASLLPVGLAIAAATVPVTRGWLPEARLVAAAILGGTAVVLGLDLLSAVDDVHAAAPERELLSSFRDAPPMADLELAPAAMPEGWLRDATVELRALSVTYPGATVRTPAAVDFTWRPGRGLALVGNNGAGKSTLALALVGLMQPSEGGIAIDGRRLDADLVHELRRRVVLVPQRPFVAPAQTVGWHLRCFSGADDHQLRAALARLEVLDRLRERNAAAPLDVAVSELSGGELRRVQLCRALLPRDGGAAELVVLDEPEAGLDAAGRELFTRLVAELARDARVLLIAHDRAVIPASFEVLEVERESNAADCQPEPKAVLQ